MADTMSPQFGLADLEEIWQAPAFQQAPFPRRQAMLDAVLAGSYDEVTSAEDYSPEAYQAFGQVAETARRRLADSRSIAERAGDSARWVGGVVADAAKDLGTVALAIGQAAGAGSNASAGIPTEQAVLEGLTDSARLGGKAGRDTGDVLLSRAAGAQEGTRSALDEIRKEIDGGSFPAQDPAAFNEWLGGHSQKLSQGQSLAWTDRTPDDLARYSLAADPDSRALLTRYITARDPSAWDQFTSQILKTPERRRIESAQVDLVENSPGARYLEATFGKGAGRQLLSAGDPINLAGTILPMARTLRGLGMAEKAVAGGAATTLRQRAIGAGTELGKGLPEQAIIGAEGTLRQDPNATAGAISQGAANEMLGSAVIGGGTFGAAEGVRAFDRRMTPPSTPEAAPTPAPDPTPTTPTPGDLPTGEGDISTDLLPQDPGTNPDLDDNTSDPADASPPPRPEMPPVETLEAAGITLDEARPFQEAQEQGSVTDPESLRTLAEQVSLMRRERKPAVLVDGVLVEQLPSNLRPREGEPFQAMDTQAGALIWDTRQVDQATVAAAVDSGNLGEILGYGIPTKPTAADRAVVVRTHDGHEVVSVAVDDDTEPTVWERLNSMHEPSEGDTIDVEPLDMVVADRDSRRRVEREAVEAGWQSAERERQAHRQWMEAQAQQMRRSMIARRGAGLPDHPMGGTDVLDAVLEHGGIFLPSKDQRQGGDHDDLSDLASRLPPRYMVVFNRKAGYRVDQMAQALYDDGLLPDPYPQTLTSAILAAYDGRVSGRKQMAEMQRQERQGQRQAEAFVREVADPKAAVKRERSEVAATQLKVGDTLTVGTEQIKVTDLDPDTGDVTLEDGAKFGIQRIGEQSVVYVEGHDSKGYGAALSAWDDLDPVDDSLELETQTPEQVVADRETTAAKEREDALRQEIDRRSAARLTGDSSNVGQGTLFEQDADLFSGPSAQGAGRKAVAANVASNILPPSPPPSTPAGATAAATATGTKVPTKPVGLTEIRQLLLERVGLAPVGVRRFAQRALGIYKMTPEQIRLGAINDLPTLAHEIGHHLHALLGPQKQPPTDFNRAFDKELIPLGAPTSRPSYSVDMRRAEGVAEFTRLWLTEPHMAMAAAPKFAQHFQKTLEGKAPRILQGLDEGRRLINQYINQPAWVKLKSHLVFDHPRQRRTIGEWLQAGYAKWINTTQPITNILRSAGKTDPILQRTAARVETWVENHRGGWQAKSYSDLMMEQTDLNGRVVGPSLRTILSDLKPEEIEDFSTYIAAKRARELEKQGRQSGFDFRGATGWQQALADHAVRFEPIRQKLLTYQKQAVRLLRDSGVIGDRDLKTMEAANQEYVPFYRLYEQAQGTPLPGKTGGKGMVNNGSGIRRLKGSDRAILDPLESIVKNSYFFRKLAEQNHIGIQFFDVLNRIQGGGKFGDRIAKRVAPTKVPHAAVVQKLIDAGVIADEADLPHGTDLAFAMWRAVEQPDHKIGEVTVRRDGRTEHWQVRDPALLQALRVSDTESIGVAKLLGPTMANLVTTPTRLLRWGATGHPIFAATNWTRDQLSAAVFSKTGYIPFVDGVRGAIRVLNEDTVYRQWVQAGGKFAGQATYDEGLRQSLSDALPQGPGAQRLMRALASPRSWKRGIGMASQILEEATRVQEFARARQKGLGPLEAANLSKEVTLNFARAGEVSRFLNQIITFFNAGLQDMDKVVREHADPKTRGGTITRGLLYITVPSVLAWALGKDDPQIQELPEWRRNFFWNINLHGVAGALGRRGFVLSIPKPFLMGAIYGTSVERGLDAATGRDPNGARKALANIGANTAFRGDMVAGISALAPLLEVATNYDLFTRNPVVPARLQGLPAEMQFDIGTSETAKGLGRATGIAPVVIDHLIHGYLGTAGRYGKDSVDWVMAKSGVTDPPPPPAKDIMEIPPFRSFASSPYERSVNIDRFYKAYGEAQALVQAWTKQAPHLDTDEQGKWWKENGEIVRWYQQQINPSTGLTRLGRLTKDARHLSELNKAMRTVRQARDITPEDKRQRLMDLTRQYNQAAAAAFTDHVHPRTRSKVY